jgi:hypothetical protein
MNHTFEMHTPDSIARLAAENPNVTVMKESYDRTFVPLPARVVEARARRACAVAAQHSTAEDVRALLAKDEDMVEFSEKYQTMYRRVTDPVFVRDEHNVATLFKMIGVYQGAERGHFGSRDANGKAMALAIDHKLQADLRDAQGRGGVVQAASSDGVEDQTTNGPRRTAELVVANDDDGEEEDEALPPCFSE